MRYYWPDCVLTSSETEVITKYPDGTQTGGPVVREDGEHAYLLGISEITHRLAHELTHHLVSRALSQGKFGCPILWAAAHKIEMPQNAAELEWLITAVTYQAYGKLQRQATDYQALAKLHAAKVNIPHVCRQLRWLIEARLYAQAVIVQGNDDA